MALKKSQKSLKTWTKQKWRTPSGKPSGKTGEVYAPAKTISKLKSTPAGRARQIVLRKQQPRKAYNTLNMVFIKVKKDRS